MKRFFDILDRILTQVSENDGNFIVGTIKVDEKGNVTCETNNGSSCCNVNDVANAPSEKKKFDDNKKTPCDGKTCCCDNAKTNGNEKTLALNKNTNVINFEDNSEKTVNEVPLKDEYEKIREKYEEIQKRYNNLMTEYVKLSNDYSETTRLIRDYQKTIEKINQVLGK